MKFKVVFSEKDQKLDINALADGAADIILPANVDQHVQFPIPGDARDELYKQLYDLLSEEDNEEIKKLQDQVHQIQSSKRLAMQKLRTKLNPKIIEVCCEFKEQNPEYFI